MPHSHVSALIDKYADRFRKEGYLDSTDLKFVETQLVEETRVSLSSIDSLGSNASSLITKVKHESVSRTIPRTVKALRALLPDTVELVLVGKVIVSRAVVKSFRTKFYASMLSSHWLELPSSLHPKLSLSSKDGPLVTLEDVASLVLDLVSVANTIPFELSSDEVSSGLVGIALAEMGEWPSSVVTVGDCVVSKGFMSSCLRRVLGELVQQSDVGAEVQPKRRKEEDDYCIVGSTQAAIHVEVTSTKLSAKQKRKEKKGKATNQMRSSDVDPALTALTLQTLCTLDPDFPSEAAQHLTALISPQVAISYHKIRVYQSLYSGMLGGSNTQAVLLDHVTVIEDVLLSCLVSLSMCGRGLAYLRQVSGEGGDFTLLNRHLIRSYGNYCVELLLRHHCVKTLECDVPGSPLLCQDKAYCTANFTAGLSIY